MRETSFVGELILTVRFMEIEFYVTQDMVGVCCMFILSNVPVFVFIK